MMEETPKGIKRNKLRSNKEKQHPPKVEASSIIFTSTNGLIIIQTKRCMKCEVTRAHPKALVSSCISVQLPFSPVERRSEYPLTQKVSFSIPTFLPR